MPLTPLGTPTMPRYMTSEELAVIEAAEAWVVSHPIQGQALIAAVNAMLESRRPPVRFQPFQFGILDHKTRQSYLIGSAVRSLERDELVELLNRLAAK